MHRALMRNPETPPSVLEILAGGFWPNIHVKQCQVDVKTHSNVSKVAIYIANFIDGKPDTPQYILEKLASDHRPEVRCLVAEHPNTPQAVLEKLAQDSDIPTLNIVARHPNLPSLALEKLTQSLVNTLNESLKFRQLPQWADVSRSIAQHPQITLTVLEDLARLDSSEARIGLEKEEAALHILKKKF